MSSVPSDSSEKIVKIFASLGHSKDLTISQPTARGGNNRSFVVDTDAKRFFVKEYAKHPLDNRDRQGTEFSFLKFLWDCGITCISEPIRSSPELNMAIYSFIEGAPFTKEITEKEITQAADFFAAINKNASSPEALKLPDGSDSVYSIEEQCQRVHQRIEKLIQIEPMENLDEECRSLAETNLLKAFDSIYDHVAKSCAEDSISLKAILPQGERCLSPSDFGFHNILIDSKGSLFFVDFEYAGWDDPARTMGDFFSQPRVPVKSVFWDLFYKRAFTYLKKSALHNVRAKILLPVHRLKWICIMLNPFLADGAHRTTFARSDMKDTIKSERITRAREALEVLQKENSYIHLS